MLNFIVKRWDKEEFLKCKHVKRVLIVNDLHEDVRRYASHDNPIYINDSLFPYNRQLMAKAR